MQYNRVGQKNVNEIIFKYTDMNDAVSEKQIL